MVIRVTTAKLSWVVVLLACCGCQIGPAALRAGRPQYNEVVRISQAEQMLHNLVRLRYREHAVFMSISSVSTQFELEHTAEISGRLNENVGAQDGKNPNALDLLGRLRYSERPTITYAILGGEDFVKRLLTPISVESISLVAESGWRTDRVLRLTVEHVNGLYNAPSASGPTPRYKPRFRDFLEATSLFQRLQAEQLIDVEFLTRTEFISAALPVARVDGGALVDAAKAGAEFTSGPGGEGLALTKEERTLVLRFAPKSVSSPEVARFRTLLRLAPNEVAFDLEASEDSDFDPLDPVDQSMDIAIDTRSLIGVMYYLSQAVQVPPEHEEAGIVTATRTADGERFDWSELLGDIFIVHCGKVRPAGAAVAVQHRGVWFYIRDDDETSKSTFLLLKQLFDLQSGDVESTKPVLTLPIG